MATDSGRAPPLYESIWRKWSRTRGPLYENPAEAICRILALCEVNAARARAPGRPLRVRAARILDEALAPVADSKRPATNDQRARANQGLVDISRLMRESSPGKDRFKQIALILVRAGQGRRDLDELDVVRYFALAELLIAALEDDCWEISLRAARTLLALTRDAYRRVGRPASNDSPEHTPSPPQPGGPALAEGNDAGGVHRPPQQPYDCRAENPGRAPP